MIVSRRNFLASSALTAASLSPLAAVGRLTAAPARKLKLLVLGGTAFLGPPIVRQAIERGHTLTLFNRGRTNPELFPDVEKLRGDRDPDKGEGLTALKGRSFDAVIDTTSYVPRLADASTKLLAEHVEHYHMVSTLSVYANGNTPGADESAPVGTIEDETVEEITGLTYGPLKALCEQTCERNMPGRVSICRAGLIVGPGDPSGRFTYWPARVHHGGEMLCPGDGTDYIRLIDVRDCAAFILHLIEQQTTGIYNVIGPKELLTIRQMIETCRDAVNPECKLTWVDTEFLTANSVQPWQDLPAWVPRAMPGYGGFGQRSNRAAIAAGLTFAPLGKTCSDTVQWLMEQPEDRRQKLRTGMSMEREAEVLSAWHNREADADG